MARFDKLESRIEQMEAEAELVNMPGKTTIEEEFDNLASDDEIENELSRLKAAQGGNRNETV
jgi:phage shock protein A